MPAAKSLQIVLAVLEKAAGATLATYLSGQGHMARMAETKQACEEAFRTNAPDLVIAELGNEVFSLEWLAPFAAKLVLVGLASPDAALYFKAAKAGFASVLQLPLDPAALDGQLGEVMVKLQGEPGSALPAAVVDEGLMGKELHTQIPNLFAQSDEMAEVRETIAKVAPTNVTVLVQGESGVGKELAARLIHSKSVRSEKAFIKVNCAAIPNELLESELFGYEVGAFTGAVKGKPGKFELADGGTVFLDEIGEIHPMLQAKLLHVLQDGDFARLGSKRNISVDIRVICASNQALDLLVAQGKFREDLYYRINVVKINVPPLRERKLEIPVLLHYFVNRYAGIYSKNAPPFDDQAIEFFMNYDWPGNVRELENLCKRYVIVGGAPQIFRELALRRQTREDADGSMKNALLPKSVDDALQGPFSTLGALRGALEPVTKPDCVDRGPSLLEIGRRAAWTAERAAIERTLYETRWNRREAARRLQISYKALLNKIQMIDQDAENSIPME